MAVPTSRVGSCTSPLRVLELFSGIGGMHYALNRCSLPYVVMAAVDINTVANATYAYNFPTTPLLQREIESLSSADLDAMKLDIILMSPPCQPFTRVGLRKDADDLRTRSFFHVLDCLTRMQRKPTYLLVENVKGFEESQTRGRLVDVLSSLGYAYQELLLTPLQFGVPNSRLRYYLVATLLGFSAAEATSTWGRGQVFVELPDDSLAHLPDDVTYVHNFNADDLMCDCEKACSGSNSCSSVDRCCGGSGSCAAADASGVNNELAARPACSCNCDAQLRSAAASKIAPLVEFLERTNCDQPVAASSGGGNDLAAYALGTKEMKHYKVMDIVRPDSRKSCCFTKRYGHYVEGAGSFLQINCHAVLSTCTRCKSSDAAGCSSRAAAGKNSSDDAPGVALEEPRLRYFTPREVANLMCFPPAFGFPENVTRKQRYRLLGNSLNVLVVSCLIKLLASSWRGPRDGDS